MTNPTHNAPAEVVERFLPQECPSFAVIRAAGEIRLWQSRTERHEFLGVSKSPRIHYHLTIGESATVVLISRLDTALRNFELAAASHVVEAPAS